jgi:hypothetical protein
MTSRDLSWLMNFMTLAKFEAFGEAIAAMLWSQIVASR